MRVRHTSHILLALIVLLGGATLFVWSLVYAETPKTTLAVAFLDVGQGDAIFIEAPNGNQVLIDGGKGRAVLRELGSVMPAHDRSIDVVIATHPDQDHIGGLPEVFARYDIGMFVEPGVIDDGADNQALQDAVRVEQLTPVHARSGMSLVLDEDVTLSFLFPEGDVSQFEPNTGSIVARLTYGETSFLLTGDSPQVIEQFLTSTYGTRLGAAVLKLGHHGSKTSTSEALVHAVSPQYAVVSAGCDNAYGHPHQEVLERLERFSVQTISTCTEGTIVFISDGSTVRRK